MAAFLAIDLALGALLLGAQGNRGVLPDGAAGRWFAVVLGAGLLALCASGLAGLPAGPAVEAAFAVCNAAGLLVGPALVRYAQAQAQVLAQAQSARAVPAMAARARGLWTWGPCAALLLVYALAALAGAAPRALELWVATVKAVVLAGCVVAAGVVLWRGAARADPRRWLPGDAAWLAGAIVLGMVTWPAALLGGEALARGVHGNAVLPALGIALWGLVWSRLRAAARGDPVVEPGPLACIDAAVGAPAAEPVDPAVPAVPAAPVEPAGSVRAAEADAAVLAAVWQAFVADLDATRAWLDPDFGLDAAAVRLGIRRHLLSEAINHRVAGGFVAVVNARRLEAFRAALATAPADEPVLAIGLRCGFGSKASLQRLVKREFGVAPGALRVAQGGAGGSPARR